MKPSRLIPVVVLLGACFVIGFLPGYLSGHSAGRYATALNCLVLR